MPIGRAPLQAFLTPTSIALFGATTKPDCPGRALLKSLRDGDYSGTIYVISEDLIELDGVTCHSSLGSIGHPVSLALIAVEASQVLAVVEKCAELRVAGAIIYSHGFSAATVESAERLQCLVEAAKGRLRLFGPSAFGIVLPFSGINLTPSSLSVASGNLALVSQSASVCANILDWSLGDGCGLSAVFVPGIACDIGFAEILDHLATDNRTACILLYLEGITDTRHFLSALRAAASIKPVIALKTGRSPLSATISGARYSTLAGGDAAFDAALRRVGVLRVYSVGDMFSAARALTAHSMPRSERLAIVANGGAPAVMAIDEMSRHQLELADLRPTTLSRLSALPLAEWSSGNPLGISREAAPESYVEAIDVCLDDPGVGAVLVLLAPNDRVDPLEVARAVITAHGRAAKPVLACWLGENSVREARLAFTSAGFPAFRAPENAIIAFSYMVNWMRNQALLRETPAALSSYLAPDSAAACAIINRALDDGRDKLDLYESKEILSAFRIPVAPALRVMSAAEAMAAAQSVGYPVTMKAEQTDASRRAAGRVRRHLRSAPEVAMAWRELNGGVQPSPVMLEPHIERPQGRWLAIAVHCDSLFGPVITLSESGIASEVYDARSLALPPLNPRLVDEMINVPYVARLLGPLRDMPAVAQVPLKEILLRVSEIASELPWLRNLDIAALVADDREALVVDVAIDIQKAEHDSTRYRHMAICPYPAQLVAPATLKDGSRLILRPIRPEDAMPLQDFVRGLGMQSKRLRYFATVSELPQHELARSTQIDYGRQLTLLATRDLEGPTVVLGEAQYSALPDGTSCDFAIIIADEMAGKGLGRLLMERLIGAARNQGLAVMRGDVAAENEAMVALMESLDFIIRLTDDPETVEVSLQILG